MARSCFVVLRSCFVVLVSLLTISCEDSNPPGPCQRDTDCPSGYKCADGTCTLPLRQDTGIDSSPDLLADLGFDALPDSSLDGAPQSDADGGPSCPANHDDQISRDEMLIRVGASVAYTIGTDLTVDLKGKDIGGGVTQWELLQTASDDKRVLSELIPIFDWAKKDFPNATYATLIDRSQGAYGVFVASQTALKLAGVISKDEPSFGSGTKLVYADPVDMLRFPVMPSGTFKTSSSASGTFDGVYLYVSEEYDVTQIAHGKLKLPQITFDATLVKVEIKQTPYLNPVFTSYRTVFMFIAECYGIVGRIVVDGRASDLSAVKADERWRLAF
jgi:hypothetical protein